MPPELGPYGPALPLPPRHRQPPRHLVRWVSLAIVVVLLGVGWIVIDEGAKGYYQYSPGQAPVVTGSADCQARPPNSGDLSLPDGQPCIHLNVPANLAHSVDGSLLMVDVLVGKSTPLEYALDKLGLLHTFYNGMQLYPNSAVLGSTPANQLACQDTQQMTSAQEAASVVALRTLGYTVTEQDLGVLITQVQPNSPASKAGIQCNDLVTAIDGKAIATPEALATAIQAEKPGQTVRVTLKRQTPGSDASETKQIVAQLEGTPVEGPYPAQPKLAFLGVGSEADVVYHLPLNVSIDVGNIGGPSAGLAMTLGLLNVLSSGKLTGGKKVAATGTMDATGAVGDVGGVAQKTVAVRKAGASLFLVPPQELKAAESEAGSHLQVKAVSTLQQALNDLKAIGGTVPPPHPSSTTTTAG